MKAPKDCGNINFYEPNEVKKFHRPPVEKLTELSSNGFSIKPEEGNLLIFPSYLYHEVGKSLSEEDRIVISFNVSHSHGDPGLNSGGSVAGPIRSVFGPGRLPAYSTVVHYTCSSTDVPVRSCTKFSSLLNCR